jgi:hypothetical protein
MWDQNTIKAGIGKKSPNVKRSELRRKLKKKKPNVNQQIHRFTHRDTYFMCLPLHITQ